MAQPHQKVKIVSWDAAYLEVIDDVTALSLVILEADPEQVTARGFNVLEPVGFSRTGAVAIT